MNTYETLKQLEQIGQLKTCLTKGIISTVYLDYMDVYEAYLKLQEKGEYKMQCYQIVAMDFCISERNVRNIVSRMQS